MKLFRSLGLVSLFALGATCVLAQSPFPPVSPASASQIQAWPIYTLNTSPITGATLKVVGNSGPATYCYWGVVHYQVGTVGPTSLGCIQGPNTLTSGNYVNIIPFSYPAGATGLDVLQNTTPLIPPNGTGNFAVATGVTSGAISQTSNTLSSYSVPTFNPLSYAQTLTAETVGSNSVHLLLRQGWPWPGTLVCDLSTGCGSGAGTVTSIAGSSPITVSPNPITTTGTIGLAACGSANQVYQWNGSAWACTTISASGITGSGTAGTVPEWATSTSLTNSPIVDGGTTGITVTNPATGTFLVTTGSASNDGSLQVAGASSSNLTYLGDVSYSNWGVSSSVSNAGCNFNSHEMECIAGWPFEGTYANFTLNAPQASGGGASSSWSNSVGNGIYFVDPFNVGTSVAGIDFVSETSGQGFTWMYPALTSADIIAQLYPEGSFIATSALTAAPHTFASTPVCPNYGWVIEQGSIATISDSTVNTWGTPITVGGGSYAVEAYCDAANTEWRVMGGNGSSSAGNLTGPITSSGLATSVAPAGVVAQKPAVADAACWVTTEGNDSNDGLSLGTAKLTVYGCLEALPGGSSTVAGYGTVHVADGVYWQPTAAYGLWIMGASDPNYSSPPAGWLKNHATGGYGLTIDCVGTVHGPDIGHYPACGVLGGSATNTSQPSVWFSALHFELRMSGIALYTYTAQPMKLGVCSDGTMVNCGVQNMKFEGLADEINSIAGAGPGILIGGNSFWLYFDDCALEGNAENATGGATADAAAAILFGGSTYVGPGIYLVQVNDSLLFSGGIKVYPGMNQGGISVHNLSVENELQAAVWLLGSPFTTVGVEIDNVTVSDCTGAGCYSVENDSFPASNVYVNGLTESSTLGPMTFGSSLVSSIFLPTPAPQGEIGFIGGQVYGQLGSWRNFAPSSVVSANLANIVPGSQWQCSGCTVTTGITAPDGTTGAGQVTTTSGGVLVSFASEALSVATGDYFLFGVYAKSADANGFIGGEPFEFTFNNVADTLNCLTPGGALQNGIANYYAPETSLAGWQWYAALCELTTASPGSASAYFYGNIDSTHPAQFYAPILLHIAAGSMTTTDVYELLYNLRSYSTSCAVGTVCGLPGQILQYDTVQPYALNVAAISTPTFGNSYINTVGTAGSSTWSYCVVAYVGTLYTPCSPVGTITTGNATLSGSNFNNIYTPVVAGATSYVWYRTAHGTSPSTNGIIATKTPQTGYGYILLYDTGLAGDSSSPPVNGTVGVAQASFFKPSTLYSAAGTPLPTCNSSIQGETTVVSDATSPTYMGAYSSGGGITTAVICSYNGSTYAWLTH